MLDRNARRAVEPQDLIRSLIEVYGVDHNLDEHRIVKFINAAFDSDSRWMSNAVAQHVLTLKLLGFTREELISGVAQLFSRPRTTFSSNPYADQKVESTRGYREGWLTHLPEQRLYIFSNRIGMPELCWAKERHVALSHLKPFEEIHIKLISDIARHFVILDPYRSGYPKILRLLAGKLRDILWSGYHTEVWSSALEELSFENLELHPRAAEALMGLESDPFESKLRLPVQFGLRWRGSSMERAVTHMNDPNSSIGPFREFPLPAYVVLCELLADPTRLMLDDTLAIDCPGDVVTDQSGNRSGLNFTFRNKRLHITTRPRQSYDETRGTASGLIGAT